MAKFLTAALCDEIGCKAIRVLAIFEKMRPLCQREHEPFYSCRRLASKQKVGCVSGGVLNHIWIPPQEEVLRNPK